MHQNYGVFMRTDLIRKVESKGLKAHIPEFRIGDELKVFYKIVEGDKERIQPFEGTLIAHKGGGLTSTITVRKISFGEGVERIFPLHSPRIEKITVTRSGSVRKAKLYYLREKIGKSARVKERKMPEEMPGVLTQSPAPSGEKEVAAKKD